MWQADILTATPPPADLRLRYGSDPNHFADLRLPKNSTVAASHASSAKSKPKSKPAITRALGAHPVVMNIHGGYWRSRYDLTHAGHLCAALTKAGAATWNIEYRRLGNEGGGWPGTFEDVTNAYNFLRHVAAENNLDMGRFLVMGHSAGGQLALCLAAHQRMITRAMSLAGVVDLRRGLELKLSNSVVKDYMGGTPEQVPEHYKEASPMELAMPGVKQRLIHGIKDDVVPIEISRKYRDSKLKKKEDVELIEAPDAGHFELIDPASKAWPTVQSTVLRLLR